MVFESSGIAFRKSMLGIKRGLSIRLKDALVISSAAWLAGMSSSASIHQGAGPAIHWNPQISSPIRTATLAAYSRFGYRSVRSDRKDPSEALHPTLRRKSFAPGPTR